MTPQIFAAIYLTAQKLREDSFKPKNHPYGGSYTKTFDSAAAEACRLHKQDEVWALPIGVLLLTGYCDVFDWAKELVK